MNTAVTSRRTRSNLGAAVACAVVAAVVVAMALDTKIVRIDAASDVASGAFSAPAYGKSEFPKVQAAIEGRAVDAATLAAAIAKDPAAAGQQYGVATGGGPEFSVKFTGVAGKQDFGVYDVAVDGLPKTIAVHLQTGPAINGTDLRDATGTINFGQFTNQIEYQNAGSALNKQMKKDVLAKADPSKLEGKKIAVVGAFQLTDPANWTVTPVQLDVQ